MSEKELQEAVLQLPDEEKMVRIYRAVEGDFRIISKNAAGMETRYTVYYDKDGEVKIIQF